MPMIDVTIPEGALKPEAEARLIKERLQGKRTVITQIDAFMGRDLIALFQSEGADVIADKRDLRVQDAAGALISEAGHVDVLVANQCCGGATSC